MKNYTREDLEKRISKKYHSMIDWDSTMFLGFDGTLELVDNGQTTKSLREPASELNWYLKKIQEDPKIEW